MAKFMSSHSVSAGMLHRGQVDEIAHAAQSDPVVQPYRRFGKMNVPCDFIVPVELEGDRGSITDCQQK